MLELISDSKQHRLYHLEALRGIAAFIVFCWHFFAKSFYPRYTLDGSPLFAVANGHAAVIFFFVLSGYVLTYRFYLSGNREYLKKAAIKRWPRLLGPPTLVCLISAALFLSEAYFYPQAGALTHSNWLQAFGAAKLPRDFLPSIAGAFYQGTFTTFFFGDFFYNSNLWTMRIELFGSYLSWIIAIILMQLTGAYSGYKKTIVIIILLCSFAYLNPLYDAFICGTSLALLHATRRTMLTTPPALAMLIVGCYFFGYSVPSGAYALFTLCPNRNPVWIAAALFIMHSISCNETLAAFLNGQKSKLFGKLSFAIYLLQIPIICSYSSWFYWHFHAAFSQFTLLALTFITSCAVLLTLAYPSLYSTIIGQNG